MFILNILLGLIVALALIAIVVTQINKIQTTNKTDLPADNANSDSGKAGIYTLFQNTKRFNDDGWFFVTVITFIIAVSLFRISDHIIYFACGFIFGSFYEQVIEYLAHGWLQHKNNKIFDYFVARHLRHHKETEHHHALQSISMTVFVVNLLLLPFFALCFIGYKNIALGVISGFLLNHALLNVLHYDIHSETKIIPKFLRKSRYYRYVIYYHMLHHKKHYKTTIQIYGITNPWLDIFLDRIGVTLLINRLYNRLVKVLESSKIVVAIIRVIIKIFDASDFYNEKHKFLPIKK